MRQVTIPDCPCCGHPCPDNCDECPASYCLRLDGVPSPFSGCATSLYITADQRPWDHCLWQGSSPGYYGCAGYAGSYLFCSAGIVCVNGRWKGTFSVCGLGRVSGVNVWWIDDYTLDLGAGSCPASNSGTVHPTNDPANPDVTISVAAGGCP